MSDAYKQLLKPETTAGMSLANSLIAAVEETRVLKEKEAIVYKAKVEQQYQNFTDNKEKLEQAKKIRVDVVNSNYYKRLASGNTEYFQMAQTAAQFLNTDFDNIVPYFARNFILIGAESGNGKSTIAGNLAFATIRQNKRVLIITNEEIDSDCYNRVTCLIKGWGYTNHQKFSAEQIETFNEYYEKLGQRMTVISDTREDEEGNITTGHTTTYEGVKALLESLLTTQTQYDAIIIDYFQNISTSIEAPNMEEWKVLDKMAQFLDTFRKRYKAPIILLSQLKPAGDNPAPYKERIERCKSVYNKVTCALEVKAEVENSLTKFTCHKSRFSSGIGKEVKVGFDRGKYVPYNNEFIMRALVKNEQHKQVTFLENVMKGKDEGNV